MIMDLRDGKFEEKAKDPHSTEPPKEESLDDIILDYLSDGDDL